MFGDCYVVSGKEGGGIISEFVGFWLGRVKVIGIDYGFIGKNLVWIVLFLALL